MTTSSKTDPDPFTIISVVASSVSALCAVAMVGLKVAEQKKTSPPPAHWREHIAEQVEELSRDTKALVKWFASLKDVEFDTLGRRFYFGETALLLSSDEVRKYDSLSQKFAYHVGDLMRSSVDLCQHDPNFAREVGLRITKDISNVADRVNQIFRGTLTNGQALDECLSILQSFERIIGDLRNRSRNN